jgi:hypothetical protein
VKENLEQRMRDTLDADFPEWVWQLKPGNRIAVCSYQGSWSPQGTRYWYAKIFVCISGKSVYYYDLDDTMRWNDLNDAQKLIFRGGINCTHYSQSLKPIEELAAIDAEIDAYQAAHPDWRTQGM